MIFLMVAFFSLFYLFMFKGTIFALSLRNNTFGGFLVAREIFVFIVLGVVLFNFYGVEATNRHFFISKESIAVTEFYIIYALFSFVFFVGFLSKTVFRNYLSIKEVSYDEWFYFGSKKILNYSFISLLVIFCVFYVFGMKHAFLNAYLIGGDLMTYRLHNSYGTSVPSVLRSFYGFLIIVYAVSVGISSRFLDRKSLLIFIFFIFLFSSFLGAKAPVISSLILFFLAYVSVRNFSFKKKLRFSIMASTFTLFLLYLVALAQFGDMDIYRFFNFLYLRVGTGQIQGAYEQFALQLRNVDYAWHALPFSESLTDTPRFNKELMMSTYGANLDSSETGVMNSFFIGEAYAIGGIALVLFSPFIVALNYILIYFFSFKMLSSYFNISVVQGRLYLQLIIPSYVSLTGDFTGFLIGKLLFMIFSFFTFLFVFGEVFNLLLPKRRAALKDY